MRIELTKFPSDADWLETKRRALITIGKIPVKPPDSEWKFKILQARHSPIRYLQYSFDLIGIPSYISTHFARHVHAQPYIKTQRNDRQNEYDRTKAPQDMPVNMIWDMNAEELMIIFNKRLCGQADPATRKIVNEMKDLVIESDEVWKYFAVPMCKYIGFCPEFKSCKSYKE